MTSGGSILMFVGAGAALAFGIMLAAMLQVRDVCGYLVAVLVGAATQVVLIATLLSLVGGWSTAPVLVLQLASAAGLWWFSRERADWTAPQRLIALTRRLGTRDGWRAIARQPLAVFALLVAGSMLLVQLVLAIGVAPNTWDSMTYHLPRIVQWLQNGSIMQYEVTGDRQAVLPVVGEVIQGWTMMLSGGDRLVQVIQWIAQLGVVFFVIAAARDLGYSRRAALFAALVPVSMPLFAAQATSSQNDLIITFFAAATMLFVMRSMSAEGLDRTGNLVLAGASAGLMVGTKPSGFLIAAAIGLGAIIVAGKNWRLLVRPALYCAVGVVLLGGLNYAENLVDRGSITGGTATTSTHQVQSLKEIPTNIVRIGWTAAASFPRAPYLSAFYTFENASYNLLERPAAKLTGVTPEYLPVNQLTIEDRLGLGLPLIFLILPALLLALARPSMRTRLAYAIVAIGAALLVTFTLRYNLWIGRFMMPSAAIAAPLVAGLTERSIGRVLTVGIMLLVLPFQTLQSIQKPLLHPNAASIFERDRIAQFDALGFKSKETPVYRAVEAQFPDGARLGFVGDEDVWEYPFSGPGRERTIVRLNPSQVTPSVFSDYDLDGLVISSKSTPIPAGARIAASGGGVFFVLPQASR